MIAQQKKLLRGTEALCNGRGHQEDGLFSYCGLQCTFRQPLSIHTYNWIADRQSRSRLWDLSNILCRRADA